MARDKPTPASLDQLAQQINQVKNYLLLKYFLISLLFSILRYSLINNLLLLLNYRLLLLNYLINYSTIICITQLPFILLNCLINGVAPLAMLQRWRTVPKKQKAERIP
jgi:hypothetical protein